MKMQSLNGTWQLEIAGGTMAGVAVPADVPGSVYSALLKQGKIEDPFYRANELDALAVMDGDFTFTRTFDVDAESCEGRVLLRCEGLDTLCDVFLNGRLLGNADNMHRIWEFDISNAIKPAGNELKLNFLSPTKYIEECDRKVHLTASDDSMRGFPHLRKAHCMFGWDWGPRLPDAGIWRDISVVYVEKGRIENVYVTQTHGDGEVELSFCIGASHCASSRDSSDVAPSGDSAHASGKTSDCEIAVTVTAPDGEVFRSDGGPIAIKNPRLWWPNGFGAHPLYTVRVEMSVSGMVQDVWERRIGLRSMTVAREKDEWGESFAITVNGVSFFSMGADYIPEDNILLRITPERTRSLLEDCVSANFNSLRVWGGGYYPDDFFYDICDELGLVVWQDFMFACAVYEPSEEFESTVKAEIADNVKRIRHHASLGLWCGNNEMEWFFADGTYKHTPAQRELYTRMYESFIPEICKTLDPQTFYWPASPSSGGGFDAPNDENRGDTHYWDVWHGNKPFSEYRKFYFRFASEFGFQSFPGLKTIKSFTLPEDRNIFSRVMEMHQRNPGANGKIMTYLSAVYLYPTDFETLLYATQLMQADAMRYGVEHWRRNRGRCMGAIYWQLNDIWPVASWASIDYFGRWKALHYYAKRFFAPVMISCEETGEMTERPFCVSQPEPIRKAARLSIANETMSAVTGTATWALRDLSGAELASGKVTVDVPALSSMWLDEMDFSDCDELSNYISYEFEAGGKKLSSGTALFCSPKHFAFRDPHLAVRREGNRLLVTAETYAKSIEIYSDDEDFILSDNYFDLNKGEAEVEILRGDPKELKVRSVWDIR